MRALALVIALAAAGGCNDGPKVTLDMASLCGHPGDTGNTFGVGQYCQSISDCTGKASLCSTLGSDNTFFCTKACDPNSDMGVPAQCGDNAKCACGSGSSQSGCGCYPNSCP